MVVVGQIQQQCQFSTLLFVDTFVDIWWKIYNFLSTSASVVVNTKIVSTNPAAVQIEPTAHIS